MDKIDLDTILHDMYQEDNGFDFNCPGPGSYKEAVDTAKELARRAVHQALILASEKAVCLDEGSVAIDHDGGSYWSSYYIVDKQSILSVNDLVV